VQIYVLDVLLVAVVIVHVSFKSWFLLQVFAWMDGYLICDPVIWLDFH